MGLLKVVYLNVSHSVAYVIYYRSHCEDSPELRKQLKVVAASDEAKSEWSDWFIIHQLE